MRRGAFRIIAFLSRAIVNCANTCLLLGPIWLGESV